MIILKWLDYYSTCFAGIHIMDINHGYVVLLHVHWYTRTPLYQILSLLHCHPYRPTDTLNTVLHVNICYTLYRYFTLFHHYIDTEIHDTITTCLWTTDTRIRYYTGYHYMDTLCMSYTTVMYTHRSTCIDCLCVPVTWIMDYIITHGYSCILVILIIVYVTWIIVTWVVRLVFPLHDYFLFWYWYSRYWTCELLICDVWN